MLSSYRHGALHVVQQASSKDAIQKRLKDIDRNLFLEKQITLENEEVWCVVVDVGIDHAPITLMEWRDSDGRPISYLAEGIIARVASMERDPAALRKRIDEANARMVERARADADYNYDEAVRETAKFMHPMHAGLLPRRGIGEKARAARLARERMERVWADRLEEIREANR